MRPPSTRANTKVHVWSSAGHGGEFPVLCCWTCCLFPNPKSQAKSCRPVPVVRGVLLAWTRPRWFAGNDEPAPRMRYGELASAAAGPQMCWSRLFAVCAPMWPGSRAGRPEAGGVRLPEPRRCSPGAPRFDSFLGVLACSYGIGTFRARLGWPGFRAGDV